MVKRNKKNKIDDLISDIEGSLGSGISPVIDSSGVSTDVVVSDSKALSAAEEAVAVETSVDAATGDSASLEGDSIVGNPDDSTDSDVLAIDEAPQDGDDDYLNIPAPEPVVEAKPLTGKDYFDDDVDFIENNDVVITDENIISMFKQEDNVVSVEVINLFNDNDKLRNRLQLLNEPPILEIKSSDGKVAHFVLSRQFNESLLLKLRNVSRAYAGMTTVTAHGDVVGERRSFRQRVGDFLKWADAHRAKVVISALIIILVACGLIFL